MIEESPNSSQRSDRSANSEGAMLLDELILGSGKKGQREDSKIAERVSMSPLIEEKDSYTNSFPSHFATYTLPKDTYQKFGDEMKCSICL